MKRLISKLMIAALVAVFACSSVFGASAKVTYVKGKVEVSRGNEWVSLKVGDVVKEAETISTGFQSEARLNYNGSVMAVPALSRITLEALQSSGNKETVSIKVDTGAVRSKVTHTEGKKIEYTARTPVGVASVRGTDFAVFASGIAKVYSGAIAYYKASDFVMPELNFSGDEEEGSDSEEPAPDLGPATATTDADEIVDNAPKGAIVYEEMLSATYFYNNTNTFYKFYREMMINTNAQPNAAHIFLAELEKKKNLTVITQNIDGLHQLAGSKKVYELHGSTQRNYCTKCGKSFDAHYIADYFMDVCVLHPFLD